MLEQFNKTNIILQKSFICNVSVVKFHTYTHIIHATKLYAISKYIMCSI